MHIVILMPVFNDWVPAHEVIARLDSVFATSSHWFSILLVDDGSTETAPPDFSEGPHARIDSVEVLRLKRNLGHQRALAVGLCHVTSHVECDAVLIMDSDGQDSPEDALRLVTTFAAGVAAQVALRPIIFAERSRRSESKRFRTGYYIYRLLHYLFTGYKIRFGNFSIVPCDRLAALTADPRLWSHYAASVVAGKLPFTTISTHRAKRIAGNTRVSPVALITHGLAALSCYNEIIGVRVILVSGFLFVASLAGLLLTLVWRLVTETPLPGWSSIFAALLVIFLLQVITLAVNFTMQIIGARSFQPFLPIRDYTWYIDRAAKFYPRRP